MKKMTVISMLVLVGVLGTAFGTQSNANANGTLVCEFAFGGYDIHKKIETHMFGSEQLALDKVSVFSVQDFQTNKFIFKSILDTHQVAAADNEAYRFVLVDNTGILPEAELMFAVGKSPDSRMKVRIYGKAENVELGSGLCQRF